MYCIGFTTVTFRKLSRADICCLAAENGVSFIEWGGDVHLTVSDIKARNEICKLNKKYSLKALSYGSYYRLGEKNYNLWREICETADAVGAKTIRIWMGGKPSSEVSTEMFEEMLEETRRLADIALEKEQTIAFEFHKGTYNDNGQSSVDFLSAVSRDNVKTYWQPFSDGRDEENLKTVLPYLEGVHVFHWNKRGKRYPFRRGVKQWKRFVSIIKESDTDINYIMEFVKRDSPRRFAKDLKTLRMLLMQMY